MGRELGKAWGAVDCQASHEREGWVKASKVAETLRRAWQGSQKLWSQSWPLEETQTSPERACLSLPSTFSLRLETAYEIMTLTQM